MQRRHGVYPASALFLYIQHNQNKTQRLKKLSRAYYLSNARQPLAGAAFSVNFFSFTQLAFYVLIVSAGLC